MLITQIPSVVVGVVVMVTEASAVDAAEDKEEDQPAGRRLCGPTGRPPSTRLLVAWQHLEGEDRAAQDAGQQIWPPGRRAVSG